MAERLWVLDTSVVAAWFFTDEPLRDQALKVKEFVGDAPRRFVVPALFHSELIHVLARKSRRDRAFVERAISLLLALGLRTVALTEGALLMTVKWACAGLSGYDATFVALAEDLGGRWLTADEAAVKVAGRRVAQSLASWRESR